jgi:DNA-directed RNA polymerase
MTGVFMEQLSLSSGQEAQQRREEASVETGATQYRERMLRMRGKKMESLNDYGERLLAKYVHPLTEAVQAFVVDAKLGPGRKHAMLKYLSLLEPEVYAFISLRVIVDSISHRRSLIAMCKNIGTLIEDEVRFRQFDSKDNTSSSMGTPSRPAASSLGS